MKEFMTTIKSKIKTPVAVAVGSAVAACPMLAFAEDTTTSITSIATSLTSTLGSDLVTAIGIIVGALSAYIALKIGVSKVIQLVKSLTGRA
jgi:hypothetical protein